MKQGLDTMPEAKPADPKMITALNRVITEFNKDPDLSAALLWPHKEELAALKAMLTAPNARRV